VQIPASTGIEAPVGTLTPTDLVAGRYQLGALLGSGGMCEVRAARDLRLQRDVAVKTLRPDLAAHPEVRRRFEGEGRAAARLCHPNVVSVYDVGEHDGVPYLVMERVAGPSLAEEMGKGPMEPERVRRLAADVLEALGAAHAAGIVHRDIKPANVLLTADGTAKVADFGIAQAVDDGTGGDPTDVGQLVGTAAYMAPERLAGHPAIPASDLYSVAVLLHEALTGRRPTPGGPATGGDMVLNAAIGQALAIRPEDRFASADEMAAALGPADSDPTVWVESSPTTVLPATPPSTTVRPAKAAALLAAALVGAVLALVAAGLLGRGEPGPAASPASTAPSTTTAPSPLSDALDRLEGTLR
jgi:serine/threonine protein kinase